MARTFLHKTPGIVKPLASSMIWSLNPSEKAVYLTFDDGPHPSITPWLLSELARFEAKATFFLVGENAIKFPSIVKDIERGGHHIGNHTFNHISGWKSSQFAYFKNTLKCPLVCQTGLFRPPYGRITRAQAKVINQRYKIVMWDVLSGDFDKRLSPETCTSKVLKHVKNGSIIVYHDSEKAEVNLRNSLPNVLEKLHQTGFRFEAIPYTIKAVD